MRWYRQQHASLIDKARTVFAYAFLMLFAASLATWAAHEMFGDLFTKTTTAAGSPEDLIERKRRQDARGPTIKRYDPEPGRVLFKEPVGDPLQDPQVIDGGTIKRRR